ncbi:MAG: hypothetical protein ACP5QS_01320 [bacterium]
MKKSLFFITIVLLNCALFWGYEDLTKVFKEGDLELVDYIDCGNAKDTHRFVDGYSDPIAHQKILSQGKVPIERFKTEIKSILGKPCRCTTDEPGAFFAYWVKLPYSFSPYILEVEYPDDCERVIAVLEARSWSPMLIDTGYGPYTNTFKRKSFLFFPGNVDEEKKQNDAKPKETQIIFYHMRDYCANLLPRVKSKGIAVSRIWVYRVKNLPPVKTSWKVPLSEQRYIGFFSEYSLHGFGTPNEVGKTLRLLHDHLGTNYFGCYTRMALGCDQTQEDNVKTVLAELEKSRVGLRISLQPFVEGVPSGDPYDDKTPLRKWVETLEKYLKKYSRYKSFLGFQDWGGIYWRIGLNDETLEEFSRESGENLDKFYSVQDGKKTFCLRDFLEDYPLRQKWEKFLQRKKFSFFQQVDSLLKRYGPNIYLIYHPEIRALRIGGESNQWSQTNLEGLKDFHWPLDALKVGQVDPSIMKPFSNIFVCVDDGAWQVERYYGGMWNAKPYDLFKDPVTLKAFQQLKEHYGLCLMFCLAESNPHAYYSDHWCGWWCPFGCPSDWYKETLINAFLTNPRIIVMHDYGESWVGFEDFLREFATAFRSLPYAPSIPFDGKVIKGSNIKVMKFKDSKGAYYAIVNKSNSPKGTVIAVKENGQIFKVSSGEKRLLKAYKSGKEMLIHLSLPPYGVIILYAPKRR